MSTSYARTRLTAADAHLRAADADRERVAEQLESAHVEGRLDLAEFQERLGRCYAAKTFGELATIVADLPDRSRPPQPRPDREGRRHPGVLVALVALLIVTSAASAAAGHHGHHPFFLVIPVLFLLYRVLWARRARWSSGARGGPGQPA
jgi:uncharacterized protein DUF1707